MLPVWKLVKNVAHMDVLMNLRNVKFGVEKATAQSILILWSLTAGNLVVLVVLDQVRFKGYKIENH